MSTTEVTETNDLATEALIKARHMLWVPSVIQLGEGYFCLYMNLKSYFLVLSELPLERKMKPTVLLKCPVTCVLIIRLEEIQPGQTLQHFSNSLS